MHEVYYTYAVYCTSDIFMCMPCGVLCIIIHPVVHSFIYASPLILVSICNANSVVQWSEYLCFRLVAVWP